MIKKKIESVDVGTIRFQSRNRITSPFFSFQAFIDKIIICVVIDTISDGYI